MRYTRQLASTALIVAAGLGMGACSAHPGAAVITSSGVTYSNADIKEAAQELFDMKLTKSVDTEYGIRTSLMNSEALAAAGASVGITVTDEQVDALIAHRSALPRRNQHPGGPIVRRRSRRSEGPRRVLADGRGNEWP